MEICSKWNCQITSSGVLLWGMNATTQMENQILPLPFRLGRSWTLPVAVPCELRWCNFFSIVFRPLRLIWIYFLAVPSLTTLDAKPLKSRMSWSIDKSLSSVFEEIKGCYSASNLSRGSRGYGRAGRLKGRSPQWKRNPELTGLFLVYTTTTTKKHSPMR